MRLSLHVFFILKNKNDYIDHSIRMSIPAINQLVFVYSILPTLSIMSFLLIILQKIPMLGERHSITGNWVWRVRSFVFIYLFITKTWQIVAAILFYWQKSIFIGKNMIWIVKQKCRRIDTLNLLNRKQHYQFENKGHSLQIYLQFLWNILFNILHDL